MKKSAVLFFILALVLGGMVACSDDDQPSTNGSSSSAAASSELFISEYCEGPAYSKYIEIYNPSSTTVDLTEYSLWKFHYSGGNATYPLYQTAGTHYGTIDKLSLNDDISGFGASTAQWVKDLKVALPNTIGPNSAIVIYNYKLTNTLVQDAGSLDSGNILTRIKTLANAYAVWDSEDNPKTFNFNGDDGLAIVHTTKGIVDVFGPYDASKDAYGGAASWSPDDPYYALYSTVSDIKYAQDHLYIRKPGVGAKTSWTKADWRIINLTVGTNTPDNSVTNMAWNTNGIMTFHGQTSFQPDQDAGQHTP